MAGIKFSGIASGIDSAALIDSIIEARNAANVRRQADIEDLQAENTALEDLGAQLLELNDLIDTFRSANGTGLSKKGAVSNSSVLTAAVGSSAANSSYTVTVGQTASTGTASFDDSYSDLTALVAPNAVGTQAVEIQVGTGADQVSISVDVTNATTMAEFVDSVNQHANASGRLSASAINVGTDSSPSYKVVFNSLQQGADKGSIAFVIPDAATGFGGNSDLQSRTVSQATNAEFTVSGITGTITRASNTVDDIISGVTLQLADVGTSTITVSDDSDKTTENMAKIVEKFNEIVAFVAENNLVKRVESGDSVANVFGSLAKTQTDDNFLASFRTAMTAASSASGVSVTGMSELGISTNRDGTLTFNEDVFKSAISGDPTGASEVLTSFADSVAGVEGFIYEYTKYQGLLELSTSANNSEIDSLNEMIANLDRNNESYRITLESKFATLEGTIGRMQSQQSALTSILAGLNN
ncbi:MAG: flagellar filament capping protein FliD [bacterium]|nr:flagellar filament capping protein FliD [bacterium]